MPISSRALRAFLIAVAGVVLGLGTGLAISAAVGAPSGGVVPRDPPRFDGDTIVRVTGSARYGFVIRHLDGTTDHPETRSEALAECLGYSTTRARARCRGELTTWYADLATLRQTTAYYLRLG